MMNDFNVLRSALPGALRLPGEEGFEQVSAPWNLAIEQQVAAVADIGNPDDAVQVVRFAHRAGLTVAVQPNGHGASGNSTDTVLARTRRLQTLQVDPAARVARIGAGVSWGRAQAEFARFGLTGLPGSSPDVTVTGFALGGGLSWFSRAFGWAADSVIAFEVITADGEYRRVTADSEADLYWALRGGGGDFALVLALEFVLRPLPRLYGGRMLWPGERAAEVFETFRLITDTAPPELTLWTSLMSFPGAPPVIAVDVTYLGEAVAAAGLLRPFERVGHRISDTRRELALTELGSITAEPEDPTPALSHAELLSELSEQVVETLSTQPIDPFLAVQIRHLGGALAGPSDTPLGPLTERFAVWLFGIPGMPEPAESLRGRARVLVRELGREVSGRKPFTFLAPGESAAQAFPAGELVRLRNIKRAYDPDGVFRSNYPVQ